MDAVGFIHLYCAQSYIDERHRFAPEFSTCRRVQGGNELALESYTFAYDPRSATSRKIFCFSFTESSSWIIGVRVYIFITFVVIVSYIKWLSNEGCQVLPLSFISAGTHQIIFQLPPRIKFVHPIFRASSRNAHRSTLTTWYPEAKKSSWPWWRALDIVHITAEIPKRHYDHRAQGSLWIHIAHHVLQHSIPPPAPMFCASASVAYGNTPSPVEMLKGSAFSNELAHTWISVK